MDKVKALLDEAIEKRLEEANKLTDQGIAATELIDEAVELYKVRNEEIKNEKASEDAKAQQKSTLIGQIITGGVQIGLTIGGWIAYDIWHKRGLRFEEIGTITSPMTKNLLSRMLPKK